MDGAAYVLAKVGYLLTCRSAIVDDDKRLIFIHLCVAEFVPLKACFLDEPSCRHFDVVVIDIVVWDAFAVGGEQVAFEEFATHDRIFEEASGAASFRRLRKFLLANASDFVAYEADGAVSTILLESLEWSVVEVLSHGRWLESEADAQHCIATACFVFEYAVAVGKSAFVVFESHDAIGGKVVAFHFVDDIFGFHSVSSDVLNG